MANPSYYPSTIQFQLSSKVSEEKGWIIQKGKEEELAKEAVLEYCVQRLLQELKLIKEQKAHEAEMGFNTPPVVRYYGDARRETLLKYRKSPTRTSPNHSFKEGKPRIPNMYDDHNEGRQLMTTTHIDGTTVAYYPSGRTAMVTAAAGFGRPGFYTTVYDDDPDMRMLATFTPSGRGVCYHMNGNVRFLSTPKGGHLANKNGRVIRQWKWPQAQVKLTTPVQFQMNQNLVFRCVSESYIVVVMNCQKESTRFFVSAAQGANEQQRTEETDQLLTAFTFSSKAAKDLLRLFAPKTKGKSKRKKEKMTKQLAEIVKSVDTQDKLIYDLECDRELARLQRKAKNLVDDWLEHYRVTIGLKSPMLIQLSETPCTRPRSRGGAYSAKTTADCRENRRSTLGLTGRESLVDTARVPSAPSRASALKQGRQDTSDSEAGSPNRLSSPAVKFDHHNADGHAGEGEDGRPYTSTFSDKISRFSESSYRSKSASSRTKSAVSRQPTALSLPDKDNILSQTAININNCNNLNLCPVAIRMQMLGDSRPSCRCSRHSIPYISDVEYQTYINITAPKNQLQIVVVVSSLHPQTHSEMMLGQIYQNQNRNRTRPCLQSGQDMYRIVKYDINTAGEGSDHTQPLLLTRHNVVPGMFLIYADGKLLFCDHIFNGYGNATRDFKKQVMKSRLDYIHGFRLPEDFRFSPSKGSHGPRAPWGGEIGGAGVDHYGSSGTLLSRSLTDIGSSRDEGMVDLQADSMSSQPRDLPPIFNLQRSQKSRHGRTNQYESIHRGVTSFGNQKRVLGVSQLGALRGRLGRSNTTLQSFSLRNNDLTFV
ncbi:glutamate-rich protein 6 [Elysia marginata]|uniref:Glutamate-rich protein 6 n=1 Tax=Elysia marginata TaxID=1093978 RepID=A0AAV4FBJ5_9GAST|nr:glutamate-rich protein 6 [Elysia marginata]